MTLLISFYSIVEKLRLFFRQIPQTVLEKNRELTKKYK